MAEKHPVLVVLGALLLLGLVITYWYVIVAALAIVLAVYALRRAVHKNNEIRRRRAWDNYQLAQRADYEHYLVMTGNPQGFYGRYPPASVYGSRR
ncbi:hypothetical protein [Nocardia vermiculata]|uniref:Uncharacterized protein n=1 Tax=Nocardia vermiculata TaxID=257274 RepID=A0A846XVC5_9NOCA|nr:hypothetical protein [Nocardia vermiculata]NKY49694.1 hypothetical protein [Nocardia vermiculata]